MDTDAYIALQVLMMPRDTNGLAVTRDNMVNLAHLSIFGGVILSYIDQAGVIGARRAVLQAGGAESLARDRGCRSRRVQEAGPRRRRRSLQDEPDPLGITMRVDVEAERGTEMHPVTEAEIVLVAIDPSDRKPVPLLPDRPAE